MNQLIALVALQLAVGTAVERIGESSFKCDVDDGQSIWWFWAVLKHFYNRNSHTKEDFVASDNI